MKNDDFVHLTAESKIEYAHLLGKPLAELLKHPDLNDIPFSERILMAILISENREIPNPEAKELFVKAFAMATNNN